LCPDACGRLGKKQGFCKIPQQKGVDLAGKAIEYGRRAGSSGDRNADEYRDLKEPTEVEEPDPGTWLMTIQCFHDVHEAPGMHLIDARVCLQKGDS